jgi:hypothetical protein
MPELSANETQVRALRRVHGGERVRKHRRPSHAISHAIGWADAIVGDS